MKRYDIRVLDTRGALVGKVDFIEEFEKVKANIRKELI